jgi:hypothetical protein
LVQGKTLVKIVALVVKEELGQVTGVEQFTADRRPQTQQWRI